MPVEIKLPAAQPETAELVARFLQDKPGAATRRAYAADLRDFFGGEPPPEQVAAFLAMRVPLLTERLFSYKAELLARGASESTVNRRLSVVRSLLRFAHGLGLTRCDGRGLIEGERPRPTRERTPIDRATLKRLIETPGTKTLRGRRDTAILRLLCENALRRSDLHALNVGDFSQAGRCLTLRRQGGADVELVPLSRRAGDAVCHYLDAAGHAAEASQALFRNLDHRPGVAGDRLTPDGLYFLVRQYGRAIAVEDLTPHRLRQSAVAAALAAPNPSLSGVLSQRSALCRRLTRGSRDKGGRP